MLLGAGCGVAERRGQGEEWSELGSGEFSPSCFGQKGWWSMLGASGLGRRGGGEGTGWSVSGRRGLASEKRGWGSPLAWASEEERGVGKKGGAGGVCLWHVGPEV